MKTQDEITRNFLNKVRRFDEQQNKKSSLINEDSSSHKSTSSKNAIAVTDDPRFGNNVLTNQIQQFRTSVESGAQFSKPENGDVTEAPLIYIPSTNNLVFSGVIPCLNNMKFQFSLRTSTGNGCFIWTDGMILSQENMKILNKLWGFYKNWVEQWNTESSDLEKMADIINNQ